MTSGRERADSRRAALSVNIGSSSLKFAVYAIDNGALDPLPRLRGSYERLDVAGQAGALRDLTQKISRLSPEGPALAFVVHRIVHGGRGRSSAVHLSHEVMAELAAFNAMAPLHQPFNLQGVRACQEAFPGTPQIGCFDTAFHSSLPEAEIRFALPEQFFGQGIRRYGFHGLSYQYLVSRLQTESRRAAGRMIMAHLGNGASLCATRNFHSSATTMGFSALDGLMMGSRSGAIDPGVLLYFMQQGWTAERIERLLYKESGLLGVSGISADMRTLRASPHPDAARAIDLFERRIVREAGGLAAVLGGLDALAFTGGIGEHDARLRATVCDRLRFLGVVIDPQANQDASDCLANGHPISVHAPDSAVEVWVLATDEGRVAAQEALGLYSQSLGV